MLDIPSALAKLPAAGSVHQLPAEDGHPAAWHLWKQNEVHALTLALAAQRPLLVRGEPGTGKSQLARAAAVALGWELHSLTMHARSEAQDVQYQFDAVRRLADAQAQRVLEEAAYWQPQAFWRALDWESACQYGSLRKQQHKTPAGHVVLIDEIDKAPPEVPNGLLDVLSARFFEIPALQLRVPKPGKPAPWPLVIFTTNEERELPPAFLRRCMVLSHHVPHSAYVPFLLSHGQAHFGEHSEAKISTEVLQRAAEQLQQDRQTAQHAQLPAPGLAEYIDLLNALHEIAPGDSAQQMQWLQKLGRYVFRKNYVEEGGEQGLRQDSTDADDTQAGM